MGQSSNELRELIPAIRMSCSATGTGPARPCIVMADTADAAVHLANGRDSLAERAGSLNLREIPTFPRGVQPARVAETLRDHCTSAGAMPHVVAVEQVGLFTLGRTRREAQRYNRCLKENKKYRIGSELEETMYQRLAGRIAVVTGSAQGFGRGIVEELVHEGAHVVVADINEELGHECADRLNADAGHTVAVFAPCDVTSLDSIRQCLDTTVSSFGGVDLFVANAGVLKAGPLDEMTEDAFDLVTRVNYTAYFLCAKAAAEVMKRQHRYCASHFMDIIQINSKSGLEGSNKNFAYAGSKFGSIGLTQSFAKELISSNIKVNAVCPGNYFEGPLWSDPQKGLFVQYLNAGKVPGARTIDDVKQFYMDKVPMRRGCTPRDVSRALFYLVEQLYETGQALPVTGGQVMLH